MIWKSCIESAMREVGDDPRAIYDIAVRALLKGGEAFSQMKSYFSAIRSYDLYAEAGVLLARAGKIASALALTQNQLRDTPAAWDAAQVYAAAAATLALNDPVQARVIVRRAAHDAEPRDVYERVGPYAALYDLLDALEAERLVDLVPEVAAAVTPAARDAIRCWQGYPEREDRHYAAAEIDQQAANEAPGRLAEQGDFFHALDAAAMGDNSFICSANFVAIAKAAHRMDRADICAEALTRALDLLAGSFGGYEEGRFWVAHGLGEVARLLLPPAEALAFGQSSLDRAAQMNDELAGGSLLVVAAEATMLIRKLRH